MSTNPGVPIEFLVAGDANPYDWLSINHDEFEGIQQSALMRGQPEFAAPWQARQIEGPPTVAQAAPWYFHSRPYSRGAGAYAPMFGVLNVNPIGSGVYAPYRLPTIAGPGARYEFGAIFFGVQDVPTSMGLGPTVPIESVDALVAASHVSAAYSTTG